MKLVPKTVRRRWRGANRGLGRVLKWPINALTTSFKWCARVLRGWWKSRRLRHLLYGLPTLLVAGLCAYLATVSFLRTPSALAETYNQAAQSAMSSDNFDAAKLYLRRVVELNAADDDALFDLAKAAHETEDYPQVATIINRLAPDDRPVHADAHIWMALQHAARPGNDIQDVRAVENHLLHALSLRPDDKRTKSMLGEFYFQQGLWGQAIRYFAPLALDHREVRLRLAKAYARSGDETRGRRWGEEARDDYAAQVAADPRKLEPRMDWADSLMFLERYEESAQVLRDGIEMHLEDEAGRMTSGLARVYTAWSDALAGEGADSRVNRFHLLSRALLVNPNDMIIFDRLMGLLVGADRSPIEDNASREAQEFLLDNIAAGRAVEVSHLILGSQAIASEDGKNAEVHLNRAFDLSPAAPVVANNLAWYLVIQAEPPQTERALDLISPVVERFPHDLRFLDTRGHIYARLERWEEAVADLERALPAHADRPVTHRALAAAYEAIGHAELAERHKNIATKLSQSQSRP